MLFLRSELASSKFRDAVPDHLRSANENADTFLIARARVSGGTVVTEERYKRQGTKIPTICKDYQYRLYNNESDWKTGILSKACELAVLNTRYKMSSHGQAKALPHPPHPAHPAALRHLHRPAHARPRNPPATRTRPDLRASAATRGRQFQRRPISSCRCWTASRSSRHRITPGVRSS